MLTSSVIIVVSEVLEAVFLISLLLGLSQRRGLSGLWLLFGALGALVLSSVYAYYLGQISDWFDGFGQEIINSFMLTVVYTLLLVCSVMLLITRSFCRWRATLLLGLTMALILSHEGGELLIYWHGMMGNERHFLPVLTGSIIGIGIGFSAGALFYFVVVQRLAENRAMALQVLLALIAAGLIMQASGYLIQADWLEGGAPMFDLSSVISESSVLGRILFAVVGYESRPATVQMYLYIPCLLVFAILPALFQNAESKFRS